MIQALATVNNSTGPATGLSALQPLGGSSSSSAGVIALQGAGVKKTSKNTTSFQSTLDAEGVGACVVLTYLAEYDGSTRDPKVPSKKYKLDADVGATQFKVGCANEGNDLVLDVKEPCQGVVKLDKRTKQLRLVVHSNRTGVFVAREGKAPVANGNTSENHVGNKTQAQLQHEMSKTDKGILIRKGFTLADPDWGITINELGLPEIPLMKDDHLIVTDLSQHDHYVHVGVGADRSREEWLHLLHLEK